jgi:hypothetical protein
MSVTTEEIIEFFNTLLEVQKVSFEQIQEIISHGIGYATEKVGEDPNLVIPILCSLLISDEKKYLKWCTHFCLGGDTKTRVKELENEVSFL